MSLANEIYKKIDVETEACVEANYSFWKFKPRHKLKPDCYQKAYNKYAPELKAAQQQNYSLEMQLNEKTIEALNNQNTNPYQNIIILVIILIIIYLIFY